MTLTDALRKLQRTERIRSAWLPGMRWRWLVPSNNRFRWYRVNDRYEPPHVEPESWDLSDPATVGCLLDLLREARGQEELRPAPETIEGRRMWLVPGMSVGQDTEGQAIAAALIALAGAS